MVAAERNWQPLKMPAMGTITVTVPEAVDVALIVAPLVATTAVVVLDDVMV